MPRSDGGVNGDFAVIPLNDNESNYGFVWIACTIRQEEVTPETTNLIWVLSSHASIAIMNCLHRQRMEEKLNELKLLTSINALKGDIGVDEWFWFIGKFNRWWKQFQTNEQVKRVVHEERMHRAFNGLPLLGNGVR